MSALTNLDNSDALFFDSIDFNLQGPSQIDPGPRHRINICVEKPYGERRFKLNTIKHLGVKKPFDFNVEFVAQPPSVTSNGDVVIRWNVDQRVDRDFSTSGVNVHIDDVKGGVSTLVRQRNPRTEGQNCSGATRSIGVDLETQPGDNSIRISGSTLLGGVTITAENIALSGTGREQFAIAAKINVSRNECGIGGVAPGGVARFWAQVENVPAGGTVSYAWSVSGATIVGPKDQPFLKVQLGNSTSPIDVEVTVTLEGVSQLLRFKYQPDTAESVRIKELRCRIQRLLRVNMFVDPLWDPLRDYVSKPYSKPELARIQRFGLALQKEINALLRFRA